MPKPRKQIVVRALHTRQGPELDVYAFFIKGADIVKVADITRVGRDAEDVLKDSNGQRFGTMLRGSSTI